MTTAVFVASTVLVVFGAASALVGRWAPSGLPAEGDDPGSTVAGGSEALPEPSFDVVLRGYRMEQVDAYIDALHAQSEAGSNHTCGDCGAPGQSQYGRDPGVRTDG